MRTLRRTPALLAALAACGLAAGCVAEAEPAPPPTPQERLIDAVPGNASAGFSFTLSSEGTKNTGAVDPSRKRIRLTSEYRDADLGFGLTMAFLVIEQDSWVKIKFTNTEGLTGIPRVPNKWLHLDPAKVTDRDTNPLMGYKTADPAGAAALFGGIVTVRAEGDTFRGTLDLTRSTEADVVDGETIAALGEKAKSVPFEAKLDGQGRLTDLLVDVPAADAKHPADRYRVSYRDYGSVPTIEPPAGETQAAPASAYDLLNG